MVSLRKVLSSANEANCEICCGRPFEADYDVDCPRPPPPHLSRDMITCNLQSESCTPVNGSCLSVKFVKRGPP